MIRKKRMLTEVEGARLVFSGKVTEGMQLISLIHPKGQQKSYVRFAPLLNLFMLFFFLSDHAFPPHAYAADEKTNSREKNLSLSSGTRKNTTLRNELELVSGYAEDIFELAKNDRWKRASKKLAALEKVEQSLMDTPNNHGADNLSALTRTMSDLEKAVAAKNRQDTMTTANRITAIAALLAKPLKQRIPTNVMLLNYYGRELLIWSEMKNTNKPSVIVAKMHLIWQTLMPQLIAEGGSRDVKKFGEIMKRLETAKTPEEYGRLAISVLDEVDNLEKVFIQRSSRME